MKITLGPNHWIAGIGVCVGGGGGGGVQGVL